MTQAAFRLRPVIPSEADVQASILQLLRTHPKVGAAWRVNSGAMVIGEGKAKRFVRFNGEPGHSDIAGVLKGGRALFVEVKRPGWKRPSDDRERQQAQFIADRCADGALAFFATSLEEVLVMLGPMR